MLTEEQANQIKNQLLSQLDNFPEDKRELVKNKILSMSLEELEEFIKQNQSAQLEQQTPKEELERNPSCIFCNIASKKMPSFIIGEEKEVLAVLELNPLSKGHSLVLPKKHQEITQIPSIAFTLAKKIAKKIKSKFKPKEIKISTQKIMDHALIEIIPIYGNETERKKSSEQELIEIQKQIEIIKKPRIKKEKKIISKEVKEKPDNNLPRFRARIP